MIDQTIRMDGGARELAGRWEVKCGRRSPDATRSSRTIVEAEIETSAGRGAQGGKIAAWQKAQVASLWTGVGSDWCRVPIVATLPASVAGR